MGDAKDVERDSEKKEPELQKFHDRLIHKGLAELRLGKTIPHDEVLRRLKATGHAS